MATSSPGTTTDDSQNLGEEDRPIRVLAFSSRGLPALP